MMGRAAINMRAALGRPTTFPHSRDDLRDKGRWSFGDLEAFTRLVKGLEKDVLAVYRLKDEFIPLMRELESNLLKGDS